MEKVNNSPSTLSPSIYLHVLLFVFHFSERSSEFLDHVLQLVVGSLFSPLFILGWVTGGLADVHAEHDNLGGHGGHLVGEAVLVDAVHVSSKSVFSIGLSFSLKCEMYETVSLAHYSTVSYSTEAFHYIELSAFYLVDCLAVRSNNSDINV